MLLIDTEGAASNGHGGLRLQVLADLRGPAPRLPDLTSVDFGAQEGLTFRSPGGFTVYLGNQGNIAAKLDLLQAVQGQIATRKPSGQSGGPAGGRQCLPALRQDRDSPAGVIDETGYPSEAEANVSELICGIDVGTTKVVALIGDHRRPEQPAHHWRRSRARAGTAPGRGHQCCRGHRKRLARRSIRPSNPPARPCKPPTSASPAATSMRSAAKGVVAVGRTTGRRITKEDVNHALEQARNIALPHNREIIHAVPRTFCVDDQKGIQDPVGMFGYRLEVDASIITGATSAVTNLVNCVQGNGVAIDDLVLQPLASGEAVLTDDERQLGVALVDIGGGTSDVAIYLDGAPWHTVVMDLAGEHFVKDVAMGLRMPYNKAEALMMQFGHVLPEQVPGGRRGAQRRLRTGRPADGQLPPAGRDPQRARRRTGGPHLARGQAKRVRRLAAGRDRADRRRGPIVGSGRSEPDPATVAGTCWPAKRDYHVGHGPEQSGLRDRLSGCCCGACGGAPCTELRRPAQLAFSGTCDEMATCTFTCSRLSE